MKKINGDLLKIIFSIFFFIISFFIKEYEIIYFGCLILSYALVSFEIYLHAFHNFREKEFFDENILMILATIGAFWIGEYTEAVLVILLFQIGEYLSDLASDRTKEQVTSLMDLRSDTIHLIKNGKVKTVGTKQARVNDFYEVLPGEMIPLDGIVVEGSSMLDTSSLTGESVPRHISKNDEVLSGMVNMDGVLKIKATSTYETSTASRILDLMEHSNDKKTQTEKFITRFSKIYTPVVVLLAILIVVIPVLFGSNFEKNLYHALVFLVMSCPCALVISTPLGFFQGIGRCSREGILVKGSNELDRLTDIDMIAFDKTGTITEGKFEVIEVYSTDKRTDLLEIAAYCESKSNHPIAKSILASYQKEIDSKKVNGFREIGGRGIVANYQNKNYYLGNSKFMREKNIAVKTSKKIGTMIHIADDTDYLGYIVVGDKIKSKVKDTIQMLKQLGIKKTVMLSGDHYEMVESISKTVGMDEFYDSLLPQDKVEKVKELTKDHLVAFVGDGMNDAPVMKIADIGISMGGIGSDATIEASDIVLMKDDLTKIPTAIRISHLTKRIVKWNIGFAISIKIVVLLLAVLGYSSIWMAVFADVGVTLISVLNTFVIQKKSI